MDEQFATKADLKDIDRRMEQGFIAAKADVTDLNQRMEKGFVGMGVEFKRLDDKIDRVILEVADHSGKFHDMNSRMDDMAARMATKDDVSRILNAIDVFAGQSRDMHRAAILHGQAITEMQVNLKDHGRRIKTLESPEP